jgi:hypothetical protein
VRSKVILAVFVACLCGCEKIKDEREVYGSYELISPDAKIVLEVAENHNYAETIAFSSSPQQRNEGKWQWRDGHVCFTALLVPKPLMKDLIQNVRPEDQPSIVGEAYRVDRCVPAQKEYGKTILEMNPDEPENFVRVTSRVARQ